MHVGIIGTGRIGSTIAYSLLYENYVDEITLVDIKPNLVEALKEELLHVAVQMGREVDIYAYDKDEDIYNADIIFISAGAPRSPEMRSRRELANINGQIIKEIAEIVPNHNPGAKYIIITNPVDAIAMIFKRYSKANWIISTGTNLETLRFRSELSRWLNVPTNFISGYVGGEHGESAVILWSTVKIMGIPIDEYIKKWDIYLDKDSIENKIKTISQFIIKSLGGTRWGPTASFIAIMRSIWLNEGKILPIAFSVKFNNIPEPVFVSIPVAVGTELGPSIWNMLTEEERRRINNAAYEIFKIYEKLVKYLEK